VLTFLMGFTFLRRRYRYARIGFAPRDNSFTTIFFGLTGSTAPTSFFGLTRCSQPPSAPSVGFTAGSTPRVEIPESTATSST